MSWVYWSRKKTTFRPHFFRTIHPTVQRKKNQAFLHALKSPPLNCFLFIGRAFKSLTVNACRVNSNVPPFLIRPQVFFCWNVFVSSSLPLVSAVRVRSWSSSCPQVTNMTVMMWLAAPESWCICSDTRRGFGRGSPDFDDRGSLTP